MEKNNEELLSNTIDNIINDKASNIENVKKITIEPSKKEVTKKISYNKEKKLRIETKTWGLDNQELTHETQLFELKKISNERIKNKYFTKLVSHIKTKLCSYKQQDILKKKFNIEEFVSFEDTLDLLKDCGMKCCYCSENVYILYEHVREMKQWSLDRINNDIGHNKNNLVIACLECNLKRRRTNKDAFMFTKNMIIVKENHK